MTVVNALFGNICTGAIAPVRALEQAGCRIVLATDTCSGDMFKAMRLALAGARVRGAGYDVTATTALGWTLTNGAAALGLGDSIGAIEVERRADFAVLRGDTPGLAPVIDPVGTVVWRANASDVQHVIVDGEFLIEDGKPTRFDGEDVVRTAQEVAEGMWKRSGFDRANFNRRVLLEKSVAS